MLAIQASCRDGHIHLSKEGLPRDSRVVVLFLDSETSDVHKNLSPEQESAWRLQRQSGFVHEILSNPNEDCWNNV